MIARGLGRGRIALIGLALLAMAAGRASADERTVAVRGTVFEPYSTSFSAPRAGAPKPATDLPIAIIGGDGRLTRVHTDARGRFAVPAIAPGHVLVLVGQIATPCTLRAGDTGRVSIVAARAGFRSEPAAGPVYAEAVRRGASCTIDAPAVDRYTLGDG